MEAPNPNPPSPPAQPGTASTAQPVLAARHLRVRLGGRDVLDGVSFELHPGEIVAIIGRSGTGKSVLLKHLIGLKRPAGGRVFVQGHDLWTLPPRRRRALRRRIGFLFQGGALFDSMTVVDNVAFPLLEHTDANRRTAVQRALAILEELGVADAADRYPAELSGGMLKRVALARALVVKPDAILYDEPTTGLDPATADQVDALIADTHRRHGVTTLMVTHDMSAVSALCQRVVLLAAGRVAYDGPPAGLASCAHPEAAPFAARMPRP